MTTLILETSTEQCIVALTQNSQLLAEHAFPHDNRLSHTLLPSIHSLLDSHQLKPSDLSSIAIGCGPGSYTGTRLGVCVAESLSFALNIPLKPFCSLLAFIPPHAGSFAFILPAKTGAYFVLNTGEKGRLVSPEELPASVVSATTYILFPPQTPPATLPSRPYLPATLNLPYLAQLLPQLPIEALTIHYLTFPG